MFQDFQPVKPSKKFVTASNHYRFYSYKLDRDVDAYCWLERMNLLALEFDPGVQYFCERPLQIDEFVGTKQLRHVLNTVVLRSSTLTFQVVKPDECLVQYGSQRLPGGWPLIQQWAKIHQYQIEFVTDKEVLADLLRARNLLLLAPFLRATQFFPDAELRRRLWGEIRDRRPRRVCDWVEELQSASPTEVMAGLAVLFHQDRVDLDLSQRLLTPNTLVTANGSR